MKRLAPRRTPHRSPSRFLAPVSLALLLTARATQAAPEPAPAPAAPSDPKAVAIAEHVMEAMGGQEAWDATRYLHWTFFGRRVHTWDRKTGDVRIEAGDRLVLMNLDTREGRVWEKGVPATDPTAVKEALEDGYAQWVNDSYWLLMPYKMLDAGAHLTYQGESRMEDGRPADLLGMTFDPGTGLTPENRYDVWVAKDTGLVEQWAYYANATDPEPRFTLRWAGWKPCGRILLAADHGRDAPWEVSAPDSLPRSVFEQP